MTTLQEAQRERKVAIANQQTADAELATAMTQRRIDRIKAQYDAVEPNADNHRRTAKVERKNESGILTKRKQQKAINLTRNLLRNFTAARSIDWQIRANVVGIGPQLILHLDDATAAENAQDAFKMWAKDCDSRDDTPLNEILACIMSAVGTDGGTLVVFDNFMHDDGRLLFWSTDQLCEVNAEEWESKKHPWKERRRVDGRRRNMPMMQERGIVRDSTGRVVAYIIHPEPGKVDAPLDEVTILPRGTAKLIKRPWRLNQLIPIPEYLPMVADMEDLYEMRTSELATAKKTSKVYGHVKSQRKEEEMELLNDRGAIELTDSDRTTSESSAAKENYEALEEFTGGYTDYLDPEDEVVVYDPTRPNELMAPFFDHCLLGAGASVGLARAHTQVRAEGSYTAFRGDSLMSWQTYAINQKMLERRLMDWLAVKYLTWLQSRGRIALPAGWESKIAWDWPRMPVLDPAKEHKADRDALKNARKTLADVIGPDWRRVLENYGKQLDVARELGIPLSVFETVAGAVAETETEDGDDQ
jgi:hypothetical protein